MANKTVKTRIQNKHDVEANWSTSFVPLAGELIIYDPDGTYSYPRFKIGDGTKSLGSLQFLHTLKTGGDITVNSSTGVVTVNDDSHNHVISNVDGLQIKLGEIDASLAALDASKATNGHTHSYYTVCDTAADVAAKTVTVDGFELTPGAMLIIKFTNANSIAEPTLDVNGTGAKPMYRYGTTTLSTGTTTTGWVAGAVQWFTYDGTGWVRDYWNNTTYTNASLGCGYGTCSTEAGTTAKTASLSSYSLTANGIVAIKFTNDVPASATLNINSKGAKSIYYNGAAIKAGVIKAGDVATFVYNSHYYLLSIDRWQKDIDSLNADITAIQAHTEKDHAPSDAEKNVQSDWSITDTNSDAYIKNKPTTLKNPKSLTVGSKTYDGSAAVTISASDLGLEQAMKFLGTSSTAISDGATTGTITVDGTSKTVAAGHVVLYNGYEYVWTGSAWEQLGQEGSFSLKTHTHTVSHTPAGTVSTPTITVTPNTTTVNSITAVGSLPSLTYSEVKPSKITAWSAGSLTGSVSSSPNRTVTLTLTKPSLTYEEVSADNITAWSAGSLPTKGSNTTVVTGIKSATSTQPTFSGTAATLTTSAANS